MSMLGLDVEIAGYKGFAFAIKDDPPEALMISGLIIHISAGKVIGK